MAEYVIKVADERGQVNEHVENARSENDVRERFAAQGLYVVSVKPRGLAVGTKFRLPTRRKIKLSQFVIFNQQFVTLIRAGLPILNALDLLIKQQKDEFFGSLLQDVRQRVKGGELLSEAFARQGVFSKVYTTTLLAGEKSGNIEEVLDRFNHFQRMALTFRKKLQASLIYPVILVVMVTLMMSFLVTFVVPKFADLYSQLGAQLPAVTEFMLSLGVAAQKYFLFFLAAVAGVGVLIWR
jgi:type IV pilus assembly protein PilC